MFTGDWQSLVSSRRGKWLILIAFVLTAFFVNLGSDGLFSAQEGRAGVLTRNMLRSGNWLVLDFPGAAENEKPVLCYWFYAVSARIFGLNEFSLRLPGALAALLMVVATVILAGKIYDSNTAFLSGYILCSMATFLTLARIARIDIVLASFHTLAMLLLYYGYFEKMRPNRMLYAFYAVVGISVMVKGPVSVVLPALIIFVYAVLFRRWKMLWELKPISGGLIVLLLGSPWFLYEIMRTQGEFATEFFVYHNIERFLGGSDLKEGKFMPLYYYFGKFFAGTLPWSPVIPFALWQFRRKWRNLRPQTWFLVIWLATVFVFFSLAAIKRGDYILPLYPAAAILIARYLVMLDSARLKLSAKWIYGWSVLAVLTLIGVILFFSGAIRRIGEIASTGDFPHLSSRDGKSMVQVAELFCGYWPVSLPALALILVFLFCVGRVLARGEVLRAIGWFLPGLLLLFVIHFQFLQPMLDIYNTNKPFCAEVIRAVPAGKNVAYLFDYDAEVIFFNDIDYVIGRQETLLPAIMSHDYLILFRKHYSRDIWRAMPQSADFELVLQSPEQHNNPMVLLRRKTVNPAVTE